MKFQDTVKPAAAMPDSPDLPLGTQEAQYQLAIRLVDYMRLGEAIRVLEALGDYRDSPSLLIETRRLKAYADQEEAKRQAEWQRSREERNAREREAERKRRKRLLIALAVAALAVCAMWTIRGM